MCFDVSNSKNIVFGTYASNYHQKINQNHENFKNTAPINGYNSNYIFL